MAKRVGANGRKKNAVRKAKMRTGVKKTLSRTLIGSVIAFVICAVVYAGFIGYLKFRVKFDSSPVLSVKNIIIEGSSHVKHDKILLECGIKPGMKVFDIKDLSVEDALHANPWIKSVKVLKKMSGAVTLKIVERKPIALVNLGKVYLIDIQGVIIPFESGFSSGLPMISGLKDTIDSQKRKMIRPGDMVNLKKFLETVAVCDRALLPRISQVNITDPQKVLFTLQSLPTVIEVDLQNLDMQLHNLVQMESIVQNTIPAPPKINLCYQNLAFVTQPVSVKNEVVQAVAD